MLNSWIIVADSSHARIFTTKKNVKGLVEIYDMTNPAGRLKSSELESGKPGRSFDSRGKGRHTMEPTMTAKTKESLLFAGQLSDFISEHREEFDSLVLICPPGFLGLLRKKLDNHLKTRISKEISKDVVYLDIDDIHKLVLEKK